MADAVVSKVLNIDIASIIRRYNRVIVEVVKSQSSGVSQTLVADQNRLNAQLDAMDAFLDFTAGQPIMDCPETGPQEIDLLPDPVVSNIENESGQDFVMIFEIARDELKSAQSARLPSGLVKFDYDRSKSYILRARALLAYVKKAEPLDLPESSPMFPTSGAGLTGV